MDTDKDKPNNDGGDDDDDDEGDDEGDEDVKDDDDDKADDVEVMKMDFGRERWKDPKIEKMAKRERRKEGRYSLMLMEEEEVEE